MWEHLVNLLLDLFGFARHGIVPRFDSRNGWRSKINYVISMNELRRHLTVGQRVLIGDKLVTTSG